MENICVDTSWWWWCNRWTSFFSISEWM